MLSYKTILAIQVLFLLNRGDKRGLTITSLKQKSGLNTTAIGQTVRQLLKYGWLTSDSRSKHSIAEYTTTRTLYDLVMVMDGEIIMGINIDQNYLPFWGITAKEFIPHVIEFNRKLGLQVKDILKNVTITELITEVQPDSNEPIVNKANIISPEPMLND